MATHSLILMLFHHPPLYFHPSAILNNLSIYIILLLPLTVVLIFNLFFVHLSKCTYPRLLFIFPYFATSLLGFLIFIFLLWSMLLCPEYSLHCLIHKGLLFYVLEIVDNSHPFKVRVGETILPSAGTTKHTELSSWQTEKKMHMVLSLFYSTSPMSVPQKSTRYTL